MPEKVAVGNVNYQIIKTCHKRKMRDTIEEIKCNPVLRKTAPVLISDIGSKTLLVLAL